MTDPLAPSPNAREVEYWNSAPTRSWAERHEQIDRLLADLTKVAMDSAAPRPGERVLDIGCGSGTTVLALAERVGPSGYVLGADVAKLSVERARERIRAADIHHAEVVLSDVSTYAFAAGSFDLAFSRFGVMRRGLDGRGAWLALRRHAVAPRRQVRAQDQLALETARLEAAVCLGDLIEGDPLGDVRLDGASCQQAEEPLQVLPEPSGMSRPHHVDRVDAGALAARQPA